MSVSPIFTTANDHLLMLTSQTHQQHFLYEKFRIDSIASREKNFVGC